MSSTEKPGLKLPYMQQFTPQQTPLGKLIPILRANSGKPKLREAVAAACFKDTADPNKLAGNTLISLRACGIIDDKNALVDFGNELVACQGDDRAAHRLLAKRILLEYSGLAVVETLKEMEQAGIKPSLNNLPDELGKRGIEAHETSSDLSSYLGWLRSAEVLKNYSVNAIEYQALVGASPETLAATKNLNGEQIAFLKAMVALNVRDWTPYNVIVEHAAELFLGEIQFIKKDIVDTILRPLQAAKLIEFRKQTKKDATTTEGRGGKTGDVKPTPTFEKEIAAPLLDALYVAAGFQKIRAVRSKSLEQIVADIRQKEDVQKSGTALEILAIRLCQMLALDFMGWRETDVQVAGGGEVDAMLHSPRLVYSRWQIQCKVGGITLEAVAKEVGMQAVTLANVLLLVSTGPATDSAETYRKKIISSSNLNIIFLDGANLQKIIKNNAALVEILHSQARAALSLKPQLSGLKKSPPLTPSDEVADDLEKKKDETDTEEAEGEELVLTPAYCTKAGKMYNGDALDVLPALIKHGFRAKLIITSPPFALLRKKAYGNEDSESYLEWFDQFIPYFKRILDPQGSLVIDIGGSWVKGLPVRSTYQFKLMLRLCECGFYLAQDFYHYNPARLPTPAEWVTIRRLRVKDAINNVWWLTLDPFIKVDNRRVLTPYSDSMKGLLKNGYKPAVRPSGHDISDKFQKDNGGAIPPNVLQFSNTESNSHYLRRCREESLKPHPARFPQALPEFFIKYVTNPGDLVLDPFAGSGVTGAAAEKLGRQWLGIELDANYVKGSQFRFEPGAAEDAAEVPLVEPVMPEATPVIVTPPSAVKRPSGLTGGRKRKSRNKSSSSREPMLF